MLGSVLFQWFPVREQADVNLVALDEIVQVALDGLAGDIEFTGQGRDVGAVSRAANSIENFVLAGEPLCKSPLGLVTFDLLGAFEGAKHLHGFAQATVLERLMD